jgi:predicted transcriptional regulator of viral defense system
MPVSPQISAARELFTRHGGTLRTSKAIRLGIHPRTLYALRDTGEIQTLGRGLYRLANATPLTAPDWVSVALRLPQAVICLISALAYHGLTTQLPHAIDLALPSHSQVPRLDGLPIRVFWFSEPAHSAGVQVVNVDEVSIRIYSPEKTIADCFKYRNKIGSDIAIEALRTYREQHKKPNRRALLHYAKICRVENVMRPYLEAIL